MNNQQLPQPDAPFMPTAITYGLIGGAVVIIWNLISQISGIASPSSSGINAMLMGLVAMLIGLAIYVGVMYFAFGSYRDQKNNGVLKIGKAILMGVVIAAIMGLIAAIFNYLYFTFIDPELIENMIEAVYVQYEEAGMDEEQIDQVMYFVEMFMSPVIAILAFLEALVTGAIGAVIAGFIQRREPQAL